MKAKIKNARLASGLSQQKLADAAGLTKQTISNIETGRHAPTFETILKLKRVLKFSIDEMTK